MVQTDASNFAIGAILSQSNNDGILHPIAFYSRKFTPPEINYPIYDKELSAIISAFEEWRPYLAGAQHRVQVVTDHKNLVYFTTTRILNWRLITTLKLFFVLVPNIVMSMPYLGV